MIKPKSVHKCIIDADIVSYRAAAGTEGQPPSDTEGKVDLLMNFIVGETIVFPTKTNLECYLTGKGNFRYDVAKTAPYKGNRKDVAKPSNLPAARAWLIQKWGAVVSQGEEADDLIAMAATKGDPETTVICSIDKDFLTVPCWMYNFVKSTWKYSTEAEATKYFYTQVLTGDTADNIKGIHRIGPVKAGKILEGITTEQGLYEACVKAYDGDTERVLENARLLWLRRYEGQMWEAPE
jgi:hypothetical protein